MSTWAGVSGGGYNGDSSLSPSGNMWPVFSVEFQKTEPRGGEGIENSLHPEFNSCGKREKLFHQIVL